MNLLDFNPIKESIIKNKRNRFVLHYCVLKELIFLPELVMSILRLEMHHMLHQLGILIEDEKFSYTMMIILAKIYKKEKQETFVLFHDALEKEYDDIVTIFDQHRNTMILNMMHKFDPNPIEPLYKHISLSTFLPFKDRIYDIMVQIIVEIDSHMTRYVGDMGSKFPYRVIIQSNPNFKTKEKHLQHLIINI